MTTLLPRIDKGKYVAKEKCVAGDSYRLEHVLRCLVEQLERYA